MLTGSSKLEELILLETFGPKSANPIVGRLACYNTRLFGSRELNHVHRLRGSFF